MCGCGGGDCVCQCEHVGAKVCMFDYCNATYHGLVQTEETHTALLNSSPPTGLTPTQGRTSCE